MDAITSVTQNNLEMTIKSAEAVNQINQKIVDANQNLNNKMIHFSVEQKLQDLQAEGIAKEINLLA
ncbi:MAG: hypothetical protein ACK4UJ_06390 [Leptonema sp. (in: bacteria)]